MRKGLLIICLVLLYSFTFSVGTCYAEGTKQFKFLGYGTYTVPEDFPDKFLEFPARRLAESSLAGGKTALRVVEHRIGDLSLLVICYLDTKMGYILAIKTVSAVKKNPTICTYIDEQFLETGKPSYILTKSDKKPDLGKFIKEREAELNRVVI